VGSDRKVGFLGDLLYKIGFDLPRPMTHADIDKAVKQFVHGAKVACEAGFDGVELHASHGCRIFPCFPRDMFTDYFRFNIPIHLSKGLKSFSWLAVFGLNLPSDQPQN
jgi:hypothetical protein